MWHSGACRRLRLVKRRENAAPEGGREAADQRVEERGEGAGQRDEGAGGVVLSPHDAEARVLRRHFCRCRAGGQAK